MFRGLLVLSAILLSSLCNAQSVYKVVGPDGKVTYTDRPSPSSSAQLISTIRPVTPNSQDVKNLPGKDGAERKAVLASLQVYYKQIIVEHAKRLCVHLAAEYPPVPGAQETLADARTAATGWNDRHASLLEKKKVVLHDILTPSELEKVADSAMRENEPIRMKLERAPAAERLNWCQQMPRTLAAPEFDLASNMDLVDTVIGYKPKR
jgi:hypothetical protein